LYRLQAEWVASTTIGNQEFRLKPVLRTALDNKTIFANTTHHAIPTDGHFLRDGSDRRIDRRVYRIWCCSGSAGSIILGKYLVGTVASKKASRISSRDSCLPYPWSVSSALD